MLFIDDYADDPRTSVKSAVGDRKYSIQILLQYFVNFFSINIPWILVGTTECSNWKCCHKLQEFLLKDADSYSEEYNLWQFLEERRLIDHDRQSNVSIEFEIFIVGIEPQEIYCARSFGGFNVSRIVKKGCRHVSCIHTSLLERVRRRSVEPNVTWASSQRSLHIILRGGLGARTAVNKSL